MQRIYTPLFNSSLQLFQTREFASRRAKKMRKEQERQERQLKKRIPTKIAEKKANPKKIEEEIDAAGKKKERVRRKKREKPKNPKYQVPNETVLLERQENALRHTTEDIPRVNPQELKKLLENKDSVLLIDLRLPEHKSTEPALPNAISFPVPRIPDTPIRKPRTAEQEEKSRRKREKREKQEKQQSKKSKEAKKTVAPPKSQEQIIAESLDFIQRELQVPEAYFKGKYRINKPSLDQNIIFYSSVGKRSDEATKIALKLGFKNAKSLYGGSRLWNKLEHGKNAEVNLNSILPHTQEVPASVLPPQPTPNAQPQASASSTSS